MVHFVGGSSVSGPLIPSSPHSQLRCQENRHSCHCGSNGSWQVNKSSNILADTASTFTRSGLIHPACPVNENSVDRPQQIPSHRVIPNIKLIPSQPKNGDCAAGINVLQLSKSMGKLSIQLNDRCPFTDMIPVAPVTDVSRSLALP